MQALSHKYTHKHTHNAHTYIYTYKQAPTNAIIQIESNMPNNLSSILVLENIIGISM